MKRTVTLLLAALSLNAAQAADTVVTGQLLHEYWAGKLRTDIEAGTAGPATFVDTLTSFETPSNVAENYAERVSGFFIPATTGDYVFFVASDDDSDIFLSTDDNPANKRLIAQEAGWSGVRNWITIGGTSTSAQKRSDQFTVNGAAPFANGIHLVAGQKYYMEGVHHEGTGGDNLALTYKLVSEGDPADADEPRIDASMIAYLKRDATKVTITGQPKNIKALVDGAAIFDVAAETDGSFGVTFQWKKNGADIPDATNRVYTVNPVKLSDTGTKYSVVIKAVGGNVSATSSDAVLTADQGVFVKGFLKREYFGDNPARTDIEAGAAPAPTSINALTSFESPVNVAENFAERVSGYFIPSTTGDYIFFVASDDDSDLFLSTDSSPANKRMIAQESGWSANRNWITVGGGSTSEQKRSDSFVDANSGASPGANGIHLISGNKYYIEAVHHEGTGGDDLTVTFKLTTEDDPLDGDITRITSNLIGLTALTASSSITQQPSSPTVIVGRIGTFSVAATTDSFLGLNYQWQKNGVNIAGATSATYKTDKVTLADTGAKYTVVVSAPGAPDVTSAAATLTVVPDTFPPVAQVGAIQHGADVQLGITFDEPVTTATVSVLANYTLQGGTITGINVVTNDGYVVLSTSGLKAGSSYTLSVKGIADAVLPPNILLSTNVTFKVPDTQWASVGAPTIPASVVPVGDNGYDVVSGGKGFWGTYDELTFVYQKKTNDFDVKVQLIEQDFTSQWARGGLQVRENTDEGKSQADVDGGYEFSAYREIHANPNQTGGNINLTPNNSFEANRRVAIKYNPDGDNATTGWGGGGPAPTYPDVWLRLKREGETITGYRGTDGVNWTLIATDTWTGAPAVLLVGPGYSPENGNAWDDEALYRAYMLQYRNFSDTTASTGGGGGGGIKIAGVQISAGKITITWTGGGTLESAASITGPWTSTSNTSGSFSESVAAGNKFYRIKQ